MLKSKYQKLPKRGYGQKQSLCFILLRYYFIFIKSILNIKFYTQMSDFSLNLKIPSLDISFLLWSQFFYKDSIVYTKEIMIYLKLKLI